MWKSKRKYLLSRGVGHVAQMGSGFMVLIDKKKYMIPADVGKMIRNAEEMGAPVGRPVMFREPTVMKGITLPERLWEKVGEPFSANVAALLEEVLCSK